MPFDQLRTKLLAIGRSWIAKPTPTTRKSATPRLERHTQVLKQQQRFHMTHQQISRTLAIAVLLTLSHLGGAATVSIAAEKPNVVLIYIDDLGYGDLGAYGCTDIPTPNIDQLAKPKACSCTASYIANPPCCPSRCSLIMGQYGQRFGKYGMSRGLPIPEDRPTLARLSSRPRLRDRPDR